MARRPSPRGDRSALRLSDPVTGIKGLGPAAARRLARLGVTTVDDLLHLLPRAYRDRRVVTPIAEARPGEEIVVLGRVRTSRLRRGRRGRILELTVDDGSGRLTALWFRAPVFLARRLAPGTLVRLAGQLDAERPRPTMVHPETEVEGEEPGPGRLVPVYPATEGVSSRQVETWVRKALDAARDVDLDRVPEGVRRAMGLPEQRVALEDVHRPGADADIDALSAGTSPAHRALLFQELLGLQLALALRRRSIKSARGVAVRAAPDLVQRAVRALPFELTGAQRRAVEEIHRDVTSGVPACRLLQGDVGSGKTVVAMLAAVPVLASGHQVALMVPTEILADQHVLAAERLFGPLGYGVVYLGGSLRARPRRDALERIATGTAQVVIGTQALFQGEVRFADLGLAVVDEQHRFGVQQRADLADKGACPHVLAMTATPIPRSLAMALHGDLDLTVIDELPPRGAVTTTIVGEADRGEVWQSVRQAVRRGERAFVVHALVEPSEDLDGVRDAVSAARLLADGPLRGLRVGLLHGRMDPMDKERVVADFRAGRVQVLATTTVIEVGVDVPEATVMVVENADRFGLAQLHQLRGRVGRSTRPGRCFLSCTREGARERLAILERTRDGFAIAEHDLRFRGPGDLMGTLQAGHRGLNVPTSARFTETLAAAQRAAQALVARPDFDVAEDCAPLRELVRLRWADSFKLGV